MHSRVFGSLLWVMSLLVAAPVLAQAGPSKAPEVALVDLGALGLKVADVQVVAELRVGMQGEHLVRPKPGYKMVVVTLTGAIKGAGRFATWPAMFAVLYEKDDKRFGETRRIAEVVGAERIGSDWQGRDNWVANSETTSVRAGPVAFKFAVTLPKDVSSVTVLYATAVGGPVELPAE